MTGPTPTDSTDAELDARREAVADFQRRWWRFARQWRRPPAGPTRPAPSSTGPRRRTAAGHRRRPAAAPAGGAGRRAPCRRGRSGFLDADEYAVQHRLLRQQGPARHYVEIGWRSLRTPRRACASTSGTTGPATSTPPARRSARCSHFLLVGRHAEPRTPARETAGPTPHAYAHGRAVRRACLFAGYGADRAGRRLRRGHLTELTRTLFYGGRGARRR